jgi:CheY-specific phosphatase CheX
MAVKFFGQFLLERKAVSMELLLKAVELQESVNLKFGETALAIKLITESDLKWIHDSQRREDLQFGAMAVKLGILNQKQLGEILEHQRKSHLHIGEALVRVGALTAAELPMRLADFQADQARYETSRIVVPRGVSHPEVWEICADLSAKMLLRIVGVKCHVGEGILVDRLPGDSFVAGIELTGMISARYHLSVSGGLRSRIARAMLTEKDVAGESEAVLDDTVLEFVNIVCGNVAAKAVQRGVTVDILPPFALRPGSKGIAVPHGSCGLFFQLHLADGERAGLTLFVKR